MTGWTGQHDALHEDQALVRAMRVRSTDSLTQVYDRYGPQLFDYCHALLRDERYAARVLHDTLLAAEAHVERLQRPEQLRGWLYALARRECQRILNGPDRPVQRRPAPEVPDQFPSAEDRRRHYEARVLAHDALSSLTGRQREAVDLTIRHGLSDTELAGVLSISLEEAAALAEGSRDELSDAVEARVGHRRIQLSRLLSVLPIAMAPPNLQQRVLASALDPEMNQERLQIARRAQPFTPDGWPCEQDPRQGHRAPMAAVARGSRRDGKRDRKAKVPPAVWPVAGAATVALLMGGLFLLRPSDDANGPQAADVGQISPSSDEATDAGDEPVEEKTPEEEVTPTESDSPSETPSPESESPSASPSTPTKTPKPSSKPTTKTATPVAPEAPAAGKLTFSSATCVITYPDRACAIVITAEGGPVKWSAKGYANVRGGGAGTLAAGESQTVTFRVTRDDPCTAGAIPIAFSPAGGIQIAWDCPPVEEEEPVDPPVEEPAN